jgi:hypothetical protein
MDSKRGFDASDYLNISQDHLVVVSLWFVLEDGKQPSFENLVAEAFLSFPARFQLEGYPDWPNAHVIGKAWVRCRTDKKWITGSASEGFLLTPLGEQIVAKTMKGLGGKSPTSTTVRRGSRQTISARAVLRIENSPAFLAYKNGGVSSVSDFDFCDLLYCTLGTTPEVLEKNLGVVRQEAEQYGRRDLTKFLDELRVQFCDKLQGKRARGGLMPQKKEG